MPGRGRKVASASAWFLHVTANSGSELDELWSCSGPHALGAGRCVRSRLALWEGGLPAAGGPPLSPRWASEPQEAYGGPGQMEAGAEALAPPKRA